MLRVYNKSGTSSVGKCENMMGSDHGREIDEHEERDDEMIHGDNDDNMGIGLTQGVAGSVPA